MNRSVRALNEMIARQEQYHESSDPALLFLSLLRTALAGGQAHVANRSGIAPDDPLAWGWQRKGSGRVWIPQGDRIGGSRVQIYTWIPPSPTK